LEAQLGLFRPILKIASSNRPESSYGTEEVVEVIDKVWWRKECRQRKKEGRQV
jgi:hypothetical protein